MEPVSVKWFNSSRCCLKSRSVWWFEYVLKHVELELPNTLPRYYRWIHNLVLVDGSYYLYVFSGEGSLIDVKPIGDHRSIDAGRMLIDLIGIYLSSYSDRRRSMDAESGEVFDVDGTYRGVVDQLHRISRFPVRAIMLETLRELNDFRELSQSMLYINQDYVMRYR